MIVTWFIEFTNDAYLYLSDERPPIVTRQVTLCPDTTLFRSFGNPINKERDTAAAYQLGVRLCAVDCIPEVEKIARAAPGARVFCRILCDGAGADWPLSRKFGCTAAHAPEEIGRAHV